MIVSLSVAVLVISALVLVNALPESASQAEQSQATSRGTADSGQPTNDEALARQGEYLVHHVAMCVYCHSPRTPDGQPDPRQLLQGAPIPVKSPSPHQEWAVRAPPLAGLPAGWSDEQTAHFLRTGETPTGNRPRLPMPPFRFSEQDARAVARYLRSVPFSR
jgi:mono/diheme cytochrome c family protein